MPKILFRPTNRSIEIEKGGNLLTAAAKADVHINASCGGDGTCGKCKVIVSGGRISTDPRSKLSDEEINKGYALACQTQVFDDITVDVPLESELLAKAQGRIQTLSASTESWNSKLRQLNIDPIVIKKFIKLPAPSLQDSVGDATRVKRELKKELGHDAKIHFDLSLLKELAGLIRDGEWRVTVTLLKEFEIYRVINVVAGDKTAKQYAIAIDIGTTTCVGELVDITNKKVLGEHSEYNAQISLGDDVISRMVYAKKGDGLEILQRRAAATIDKIVKKLLRRGKIKAEEVELIVLAGNTIMTHLLYGVSTDKIREAPYVPVFRFAPIINGRDIGLAQLPVAKLVAFPCVASYLGGDITAGVVASGLINNNDLSLYIDIGTNGEIVLGNSEWMLGCSCSAGPAFEGGGVKDGIRSIDGAIERIIIERETYETVFTTIGSKVACGICGSGLIDLIAELFLSGVIDKRGKINRNLSVSRIRKGEHGWEFVVAWANTTSINRDIVITEIDIDNLMRAKAAVYAGITTLVDSVGVKLKDLDKILIAGSFGNYIRVKEAVTIGLLPDLPVEKFVFVGNGSLLGCVRAAINIDELKQAEEITKSMSYQELSADNSFMERYTSALFLPHTDKKLFPSVVIGS